MHPSVALATLTGRLGPPPWQCCTAALLKPKPPDPCTCGDGQQVSSHPVASVKERQQGKVQSKRADSVIHLALRRFALTCEEADGLLKVGNAVSPARNAREPH